MVRRGMESHKRGAPMSYDFKNCSEIERGNHRMIKFKTITYCAYYGENRCPKSCSFALNRVNEESKLEEKAK